MAYYDQDFFTGMFAAFGTYSYTPPAEENKKQQPDIH